MKIFNGKKETEIIISRLKKKIEKEKEKPKLAVIWVGDNVSSKLFIKKKKELAQRIGAKLAVYKYRENTKEQDVLKKIESLNNSLSVHGIIVQLPLPKGFDTQKVMARVSPKKDVDGFHIKNRQLLKKGEPYFYPIIPSVIYSIIERTGKKNGRIVALVNSDVFGKTLKDYLDRKRINIKYFSRKNRIPDLKSADVVISIKGAPGLVKGDMIKKGAVLIDGGNTFYKGKVAGDMDRGSLGDKPSFLTPVPGGLGPVSVALLFENLYSGFKKYGNR
ncbi:MAG: bifunctional 5,10-methylenetetrahydrofolate dehydrogenase/5,10-methenyltetrahydrofolate cyclohydrolase [Candidatus Paceibacterota bacterium]|jgi:methylenetetrahydrofolate dehydrogenase (NADP+)/methenyltetrahydrofolate cyclohydrolase